MIVVKSISMVTLSPSDLARASKMEVVCCDKQGRAVLPWNKKKAMKKTYGVLIASKVKKRG